MTFSVPIRFIFWSITFQALSVRLNVFDLCLQSLFCASHGYNALPCFLPFLRTTHARSSSFDAVGQEADHDDVVQLRNECGPSREPCSASLTDWHSTCSTVATRPDTQKPLFVIKLTQLSQLTGMHLSCGQHARHPFVAHCIEVCWRKGHWIICTLFPPDIALDLFSQHQRIHHVPPQQL